jgi:hypothetical protein
MLQVFQLSILQLLLFGRLLLALEMDFKQLQWQVLAMGSHLQLSHPIGQVLLLWLHIYSTGKSI